MTHDFIAQLNPPKQPGGARWLDSFEMNKTVGNALEAVDYITSPLQERRKEAHKGRNWSGGDERAPLHIYKYRHLETESEKPEAKDALIRRARDLLVHGLIWMSAPRQLNDPYDMRFRIRFGADRKVLIRRHGHIFNHLPPHERMLCFESFRRNKPSAAYEMLIRSDLEKRMGVFCASQDPRNEPMWAHYGADHRGFCVQLRTIEDGFFLNLGKVKYTNTFPTIDIPTTTTNPPWAALRSKSVGWSYEREWRICFDQNDFAFKLRPKVISGVILGARASEATRAVICQFNDEREATGHPRFALFQATQHTDRYGMRIIRA
jgi:hypothetical protein